MEEPGPQIGYRGDLLPSAVGPQNAIAEAAGDPLDDDLGQLGLTGTPHAHDARNAGARSRLQLADEPPDLDSTADKLIEWFGGAYG
jgi:hypothetical protein